MTSAARSGPTLTALVVYQRPAPRPELLALFAELGIFVAEGRSAPSPSCDRSDFAVLLAGGAEGPPAATGLCLRGRPVVVSLMPGADCLPYVGLPLLRVVNDLELGPEAVAWAAREARMLRRQ